MRVLTVILLVAALAGGDSEVWSAAAGPGGSPLRGEAPGASADAPRTSPVAPLPPPLRVVREFAPPPTRYTAGHRGVDLAAPAGTPVRAPAPGVVLWAGQLAGRGVVSVRHGSVRSTYEPVSAQVVAGEAVTPGTVIGALEAGHPRCPVVACLHWGLRTDERYFDPFLLLGNPIRLLPTGPVGSQALG